ncbi:MAG: hypothetical protein ACOCYU_07975, partial [Brevefilum sp.]
PEEEYGDDAEDVDAFFNYMDEMRRVRELGGLHVIGSERHEARRIDNQLRGRAARQGDPGSSRFYLSLDDDLMRLFGGAQVETLLDRLNIDEGVPIESGLIGRLVESSQKRVEGANFDVRKHLLEYDDVLNSQRERIYQQRERIFDKEDLREDVTEMLRTEVSRRVEEGMQDPEGPWKLMAYLEETQPPIDFESITHPSYTLKLMMDRVGAADSPETLAAALIDLSEDALSAWHDHLHNWAVELIQQSRMGFDSQLTERLDLLDTFIEGLGYGQIDQARDISKELTDLVHIPLRLDQNLISGLEEGSFEAVEEVRKQVGQTLKQIFVHRLLLTFEKRLNDNWNLKAADLISQPWDEIEPLLIERVDDTLKRRADRILGDDGEIARDLETNRELLEEALEDPGALMRLLVLMTYGKVITFDDRTHRRKMKATRRLTYIFHAAHQLDGQPLAEVQADILQHLERAQDNLAQVWGGAELDRLYKAGHTLGNLTKDWQNSLRDNLGETVFSRVKNQPLDQITEEDRQAVVETLGSFAQNQLYRQLLLSKISELWVEYLTRVEALRVSVRMEAYGQKDPLVAYKGGASEMFSGLLSDIRAGVISQMFRARLMSGEDLKKLQSSAKPAEESSNGGRKRHKKKSRKRH